jgi:predicted metal-binding membrane protein
MTAHVDTQTNRAAVTTAAAATLGVAAVCWLVAIRQMDGMDMGVATELGSFAFFIGAWASMVAAMMLPGALQAVLRRARASGRAGAYELTPVKRACRRRCRASSRSGFGFGLACLGSSTGLMLMLVAVGVMSVSWMAIVAALVLAQKLLPPRTLVDVPLAVAIVVFGVLIVLAPGSIPGLTPPM